jgi:hypothetical protein
MTRICLKFLLFSCVVLSAAFLLAAQDGWRVVPTEFRDNHQPRPDLRAIGIPATAIYKGEKRKAFIILSGTLKEAAARLPRNVHAVPPVIEVHIDGFDQLLPEGRAELFDGPPDIGESTEIRVFKMSIIRGGQVFRASNWVNRYIGEYPDSIVGPDGNVLGIGVSTRGQERTAWLQFLREMSNGFDRGQILIGGKALSPNIEIDFSSKRVDPLLKDLLRDCFQ